MKDQDAHKIVYELLGNASEKSIDTLLRIFENPKRAIETLDYLIRSPKTSEESRKQYQNIRSAIENYFVVELEKERG